jgi:imidazolonepropionase-like amidohydrolase
MKTAIHRVSWVLAGTVAACSSLANDPYPSTYQAGAHPPTLIRGATVLIGDGGRLDNGDVLMVDGRIEAVGQGLAAPAGAQVIEAQGRWVTPGLIDVHSHLGVYASPGVAAHSDGNEMTSPVTAQVWAEHAVWPQDPGFEAALRGGVTTLQILPGSANLIGGRTAIVRNVPATTYQAMKFPGAPHGLKIACGENPKRVYGERNQLPSTRMGNLAGYRQAFADAREYARQWDKYARDLAAYEKQRSAPRKGRNQKEDEKPAGPPSEPRTDFKLQTLAEVLEGNILVHIHCYRADEMATMLDLAREFGFRIAAFHHGVEAYKLSARLAKEGVCGALWADWWGFKMEAFDGIQENLALIDYAPGGCAIVHSDSSEGVQRLNQEAAKSMSRGIRMGMDIPPERAIRWLTANAARSLGLEDCVGTLAAGRMADVVIWNRNPFSVYALAGQVFIDGTLMFDRDRPLAQPHSDFLLGQGVDQGLGRGAGEVKP